jgi:acetyl esterase/lipase
MRRRLAALLLCTIPLTGCLVPNPAPGDVAPTPVVSPDLQDVAYGPAQGCAAWRSDEMCGGSNLLDVYHSTGGAPRGTIVWVHGGAFWTGDKSDLVSAEPVLAQLSRGWSVVAVNYRLLFRPSVDPPDTTTTTTVPGSEPAGTATPSPPVLPRLVKQPFPDSLDDVALAVAWVRTRGSSVGIDGSRVVVAGHSAGGTLAALAGLAWNSQRPEFRGLPRPDAWVSLAGPLNLAADDMAPLVAALSPDGAPLRPEVVSPLEWIDADDPPGYVAQGVDDTVVDVAHARAAEFVYGLHHLADRVRVDIVDTDERGRPFGSDARWHSPGKGVNLDAFNRFVDAL